MMMINPDVIKGNFGAPKPAPYTSDYEGGENAGQQQSSRNTPQAKKPENQNQ